MIRRLALLVAAVRAPGLVSARKEIEAFDEDRCNEDWQAPHRYSG